MFWAGFIVGIFVGFFLGVFTMGLCFMAAEGDRAIERASSLEQESD